MALGDVICCLPAVHNPPMCNLYHSTPKDRLEPWSKLLLRLDTLGDYKPVIAPRQPGPFIRPGRADIGTWGLIPWWSTERTPKNKATGRPLSTNNCRRETMATAPSFRDAWKAGQRCLIPADSYDEPYWGTGKNIWWRFARADSTPWALAGLWSEWQDKETGEIVISYTMLTQNCDDHPLLKLMHKPDGAVPPDKRAVVPIEPADWEQWLTGTPDQAKALIAVPPVEAFRHGAADPAQQIALPIAG